MKSKDIVTALSELYYYKNLTQQAKTFINNNHRQISSSSSADPIVFFAGVLYIAIAIHHEGRNQPDKNCPDSEAFFFDLANKVKDTLPSTTINNQKYIAQTALNNSHIFTIGWEVLNGTLPFELSFFNIVSNDIKQKCHFHAAIAALDQKIKEAKKDLITPFFVDIENRINRFEDKDKQIQKANLLSSVRRLKEAVCAEIEHNSLPKDYEDLANKVYELTGKIVTGAIQEADIVKFKNETKPYQSSYKLKTALYAFLGAALGFIAGATIGFFVGGGVIGAAIGGAGGAVIGASFFAPSAAYICHNKDPLNGVTSAAEQFINPRVR
ncbi:TPA: hypothetical protein RJD83_002625 [Legionella pneumophila]|nr:hypothetical protein [Legionella pneumophila]